MKPRICKLVVTISLFVALTFAMPCLAQNLNAQVPRADVGSATVPNKCDLAGVWYGGSPVAQYMLTIIQNPGGNYTMIGAAAFTQQSLGYPVTTPFSTSVVKLPGNRLEFFGTGMVNKSDGFPAPNPELWAVHATGRLTSGDSLQLDYDFFGGYFTPTDKRPFISNPDYVVVPPPFTETYNRMPTKCALCGGK